MAFSAFARTARLAGLTLGVLYASPSHGQGGQLADYQRSAALHKQLYRTAYTIFRRR